MDRLNVICFDIDGVLCAQVERNYEDAEPNREMIDLVNSLYQSGVRIVLHTSRFMGRAGNDPAKAHELGYEFTKSQLSDWGVRYHELHMGKPRYQIVIDDRSIFYRPDPCEIAEALKARFEVDLMLPVPGP